jgi:hypothetical protein
MVSVMKAAALNAGMMTDTWAIYDSDCVVRLGNPPAATTMIDSSAFPGGWSQ